MEDSKSGRQKDEASLETLLSNLPPILPPTHSRFPTTSSKTFLEAIANAKAIEPHETSEEAVRIFEFLKKISGDI